MRAGGPTIQRESDKWIDKYGSVDTGDVAVTSGGNMLCKYVIHAGNELHETITHHQLDQCGMEENVMRRKICTLALQTVSRKQQNSILPQSPSLQSRVASLGFPEISVLKSWYLQRISQLTLSV